MAILRWLRKNSRALLSALAAILAGIIYALAHRPDSGVSVRQRERAERAEAEQVIGETETERAAGRKNRASANEKGRGKVFVPLFILTLLLGASVASAGQSSNLPYVPGDYASLKTRYLELWQVSEEWRALYYDAEASVTTLQESNARLQQIIAEQAAEIEQLKHPRPAFGVFGGGSYSPAGPGVFVGGSITF